MTSRLEWDENHAIGIAVFDEQHKKIVGLLNNLSDAIKHDGKTEQCGILISELISAAGSHCAAEEAALKKYNYPHIKRNYDEHNEIKIKISELHQKCVAGDMTGTVEILQFITLWMGSHLKNSELNYGPFLLEKGYK